MKRVSILIAAIIGLAVASANAQQYYRANVGATNNVPNNSTTTANLGSTITVTDYTQIGFMVKFALDGSGTTACTFGFKLSMDGTNFNTGGTDANVQDYKVVIQPNGATAVSTNVTVNVGAAHSVKLAEIIAANNSAAMTNILVMYSLKPRLLEYRR